MTDLSITNIFKAVSPIGSPVNLARKSCTCNILKIEAETKKKRNTLSQ